MSTSLREQLSVSTRRCSHKCGQYALFDLNDRYNLGSKILGQTDNALEKLLPWILQHTCLTINRYLVHSDGLTNTREDGVSSSTVDKYNAAICNFAEMVLPYVKHITNQKLAIRNQEQKVKGMWLGKTTNNGEHIIATSDIALKNNGVQSTQGASQGSLQINNGASCRELFTTIQVPMMETTMRPDYFE
eukprot:6480239-Amphidinium_carterae.5